VSFDATGQRMLYLRGGETGGRAVVRDLRARHDTELPLVPGQIWRARLDPEGRNVLVHALPRREDWPTVATTLAARSCRGPAASYSVFGGGGSVEPVTQVLAVAGGPARSPKGLVMPFGDGELVRDDDGGLVIVAGDGARLPLTPASCGAQVLHADPRRQLLVGICSDETDEHGEGPLRIFARGSAQRLEARARLPDRDRWQQTTDRYVDVGSAVVDLEARRLAPSLARGPQTVWETGLPGRDLLLRGDGAILRAAAAPARFGALTGPLRWQPRAVDARPTPRR
jgi:hypothetical protein